LVSAAWNNDSRSPEGGAGKDRWWRRIGRGHGRPM